MDTPLRLWLGAHLGRLLLWQGDWPAADGSSGITSSKVMDDAEEAGRAVEVGSNFFLFFSSRTGSTAPTNMTAMGRGRMHH